MTNYRGTGLHTDDDAYIAAPFADPFKDRLFVGVFPTGISYADRTKTKDGDYAPVAFLTFATLAFDVRDEASPLVNAARAHARKVQARRGESFPLSTCGAADLAAGAATGQTVRLGGGS